MLPQYQSASLSERSSVSETTAEAAGVAVEVVSDDWDDGGRMWERGGSVGAEANFGITSPQSQRSSSSSTIRTCASELWTTCLQYDRSICFH